MEELRNAFLNAPRETCLTFPLDGLHESFQQAKATLETHGVIFLTEAINEKTVDQIKADLIECHNEMFGKDMYEIIAEKIEDIPIQAKAGIMGNKGFAYLYKQPAAPIDYARVSLSKDTPLIFFEHCPVFAKVNLKTLLQPEQKRLVAAILALSHYEKVTVSQDSAKVSYNHRRGANPWTVPHMDLYDAASSRYQMILTVAEGSTKLFYAPFVWGDRLKTLLGITQMGFRPIEEEAAKVIKPFMVAAPPRSLVIWKSGVVHAEWLSGPLKNGLFYPVDGKQELRQLTIRLAIGTHIPVTLSDLELKKLAILAEEGYITSRYLKDPYTPIEQNKMHKAKTSYLRHRHLPRREIDKSFHAVMKVEHAEYHFDRLPLLLQHLYGVPLKKEVLFDLLPDLKRWVGE